MKQVEIEHVLVIGGAVTVALRYDFTRESFIIVYASRMISGDLRTSANGAVALPDQLFLHKVNWTERSLPNNEVRSGYTINMMSMNMKMTLSL